MVNKLIIYIKNNGFYFSLLLLFGKIKRNIFCKLIEYGTGWKNFKIEGDHEIVGIKNIRIGENFYAKHGCWIEAISEYEGIKYYPEIKIGANFSASAHAHISCVGKIYIGNNVLLGSNVLITDNIHGQYDESFSSDPSIPPVKRLLGKVSDIVIEDNVWLCDDVKILPGSYIGAGSVIAAGSIVHGTIPPNSIAIGSPAKIRKIFDQESKKWINYKNGKYF